MTEQAKQTGSTEQARQLTNDELMDVAPGALAQIEGHDGQVGIFVGWTYVGGFQSRQGDERWGVIFPYGGRPDGPAMIEIVEAEDLYLQPGRPETESPRAETASRIGKVATRVMEARYRAADKYRGVAEKAKDEAERCESGHVTGTDWAASYLEDAARERRDADDEESTLEALLGVALATCYSAVDWRPGQDEGGEEVA